MILVATGHRPPALGGYHPGLHGWLTALAGGALDQLKPDRVISGMALGWDQAVARAALNRNIPFTAALPFADMDAPWPPHSKKQYRDLLAQATEIVEVNGPGYTNEKYIERNRWMVDEGDEILALYHPDGIFGGGTRRCLEYALDKKKPVYNLWGTWVRARSKDPMLFDYSNPKLEKLCSLS